MKLNKPTSPKRINDCQLAKTIQLPQPACECKDSYTPQLWSQRIISMLECQESHAAHDVLHYGIFRGIECHTYKVASSLKLEQVTPFIKVVERGNYPLEQKHCDVQKTAIAAGHALASIEFKNYCINDLHAGYSLNSHIDYQRFFARLAINASNRLAFLVKGSEVVCGVVNELTYICNDIIGLAPTTNFTSGRSTPSAYLVELRFVKPDRQLLPELSLTPLYHSKGKVNE